MRNHVQENVHNGSYILFMGVKKMPSVVWKADVLWRKILLKKSDSDSDNVYSTKIDTDTISGLQKT